MMQLGIRASSTCPVNFDNVKVRKIIFSSFQQLASSYQWPWYNFGNQWWWWCHFIIVSMCSAFFWNKYRKHSDDILKPRPNNRNMWTEHIATLLGATCCVRLDALLRHVGCCWLKFEDGQIWDNNTQSVARRWPNAHNMLRSTMLPYAVLTCCDHLAAALVF